MTTRDELAQSRSPLAPSQAPTREQIARQLHFASHPFANWDDARPECQQRLKEADAVLALLPTAPPRPQFKNVKFGEVEYEDDGGTASPSPLTEDERHDYESACNYMHAAPLAQGSKFIQALKSIIDRLSSPQPAPLEATAAHDHDHALDERLWPTVEATAGKPTVDGEAYRAAYAALYWCLSAIEIQDDAPVPKRKAIASDDLPCVITQVLSAFPSLSGGQEPKYGRRAMDKMLAEQVGRTGQPSTTPREGQ